MKTPNKPNKIKTLFHSLALCEDPLSRHSQQALLRRNGSFLASIVATGLIMLSPGLLRATLLSYESFDYSTGNLAGQNGGTGFTGSWVGVGNTGAATVETNSLSYPSLSTTGNKTYTLPTSTTSGASRTFSAVNTGTVYMSFLGNLDDGNRFFALRLYGGVNQVAFIGKQTSASDWSIQSNAGGNVNGNTGVAASLDTTFLFVLRIDFDASGSNERLRLYMNPTLGTEPGAADADITSLVSFQIDKLDLASGYTSGGGSTTAKGWFDEIRMGTTYADVTPVPEPSTWMLLGTGALTIAVAMRRRRAARTE